MDSNNYGKPRRILTDEQQRIAAEFAINYQIDMSQISFEGDNPEPIFDYEALNLLRLQLSDIQTTDSEIAERNMQLGIVTVRCTAVLPDGRSASDLGSAQFATYDDESKQQLTEGEVMPDGTRIENMLQAQNVALARALRRALRAVGFNPVRARNQFLQTGKPTFADIDQEFQSPIGKEIHKLAADWGHIVGKDKTGYQDFIEGIFGNGKRSTLDLNDIEKSQLANMYRTLLGNREAARNVPNVKKAA